ncbi:MAG: hypothetical protein K2H58_02345, partial [Paramuribaculum sp.]|nr:hypothetical protein [Paramuribaculum sp.]
NMANGQGAAMALPIYGLYMKKVYGDPSLPYSQDVKFPSATFDLCERTWYGAVSEEPEEVVEESISGAFD